MHTLLDIINDTCRQLNETSQRYSLHQSSTKAFPERYELSVKNEYGNAMTITISHIPNGLYVINTHDQPKTLSPSLKVVHEKTQHWVERVINITTQPQHNNEEEIPQRHVCVGDKVYLTATPKDGDGHDIPAGVSAIVAPYDDNFPDLIGVEILTGHFVPGQIRHVPHNIITFIDDDEILAAPYEHIE